MARTRTFLAVALNDAIRQKLQAAQAELAASGVEAKWTNPANFHATLQFLGEIGDRELADLCRVVPKAAAKVEPFRLSVTGLGAFPNLRRPRVVWAGVGEGAAEIAGLYDALGEALGDAGIAPTEDRAYRPHITLGRVQGEADSQAIAAAIPKYKGWTAGMTTVDEVLILASDLKREGPEYSVLGRGKLAA